MKPVCPYCEKNADLVTGAVIYPRRPDLHELRFWLCKPCKAYVGCHRPGVKLIDHRRKQVQSDGTYPLGRLADAELRAAKQEAHAAFDGIWKAGLVERGRAYKLLSEELGIPKHECHIGMFDVRQCHQVVHAAARIRTQYRLSVLRR